MFFVCGEFVGYLVWVVEWILNRGFWVEKYEIGEFLFWNEILVLEIMVNLGKEIEIFKFVSGWGGWI